MSRVNPIASLPGLVRALELAEGRLADVARLTRERDELLMALQDLLAKIAVIDDGCYATEVEAARAAIAAVEARR